ncbi:MAG: hypothetical protein ACRDIA_03515 [Actinomycetota bacterium]
MAFDTRTIGTAIEVVAAEVAGMLRMPGAAEKRIPRSEWTLGQAAAHIALAQTAFAQILKGAESPFGEGRVHDFAPVNAKYLSMFTERDGPTLAGLIEERTLAYLDEVVSLPPDHMVSHHWGKTRVDQWSSYMLFHLLMHGCAMAKAVKRPPPVRPEYAPLLVPFLKMVTPRMFDPGKAKRLKACFDVRVRGQGRFFVTVDSDRAEFHDSSPRRADCHLSVDPVAFFMVAGGVISQWGPILKGQMLAWGRKPWLAFRFKSMFPNP